MIYLCNLTASITTKSDSHQMERDTLLYITCMFMFLSTNYNGLPHNNYSVFNRGINFVSCYDFLSCILGIVPDSVVFHRLKITEILLKKVQ
jgi:hypothetical protein